MEALARHLIWQVRPPGELTVQKVRLHLQQQMRGSGLDHQHLALRHRADLVRGHQSPSSLPFRAGDLLVDSEATPVDRLGTNSGIAYALAVVPARLQARAWEEQVREGVGLDRLSIVFAVPPVELAKVLDRHEQANPQGPRRGNEFSIAGKVANVGKFIQVARDPIGATLAPGREHLLRQARHLRLWLERYRHATLFSQEDPRSPSNILDLLRPTETCDGRSLFG